MTRSECERKCREIVERYEGRYFSRWPEFDCIEYALVNEKGCGFRKSRVSVSIHDEGSDEWFIGAVHTENEYLSPSEEWLYSGYGCPCDSYEEIPKMLERALKWEEERGIRKKAAVQMTLFDFMEKQ